MFLNPFFHFPFTATLEFAGFFFNNVLSRADAQKILNLVLWQQNIAGFLIEFYIKTFLHTI